MSEKFIRFSAGRPEFAIAALLFVLTAVLFWPATGYDYINLDDHLYIPENPMVSSGFSWGGVHQAFTAVYEQWWLPLLWISYMADIELFGAGPFGHHLVNVLLHAVNAGLLFWALFRMTGARWRCFFVAALFAWHPLRMESVAWITERKDVLSGVFFMLALLAHVRDAAPPPARRMGRVFALMLLGLMAKSSVVVLPFLLLLLDYWPLGRGGDPWGRGSWGRWRPLVAEKIPLFALSAIFIVLTLITHGTAGGEHVDTSLANRLTLIAPNYWSYLGKIFWPARLTILYPTNVATSWIVRLLAPLGLLILTGCAWHFRKAKPVLMVGWLWFLMAMAPVVRGIRFDELSAFSDRYTYLPGIGIGWILAWAAAELTEKSRRLKGPVAVACGLVLSACLVRAHEQLPWWRNSLVMFQRAAQLAPESHFVRNSLGLALVETGRVEEGAAQLEQALRLLPGHPVYLSHLGAALLKLGRAEDALALQNEAIRLRPNDANYHNNRGKALMALGRKDEAQGAYEEALRLAPAHPEAHYNLGFLFYEGGRAQDARPHFQAAVAGRPGNATMWFNLGMAQAALGNYAAAISGVRRALALEPQMPNARESLRRLELLQGVAASTN